MVPVNVNLKVPQVVGLYEGNTSFNHLKVMAHTKVGSVPTRKLKVLIVNYG